MGRKSVAQNSYGIVLPQKQKWDLFVTNRSHSHPAAEAAIRARLLLLWPVAFADHRSASANPCLAAGPFTVLHLDCSFGSPEGAFLNEVLFRVLRLF